MGIGKGSSSSKRIKVFASKRVNDKRSHTEMLLNAKSIRFFRENKHEELQLKMQGAFSCSMHDHRLIYPLAMNNEERQNFEKARDIPDRGLDNDSNLMNIDDILDGSTIMGLSHAGGEFQQILEEDLLTENQYGQFIHYKHAS
jgi:Txe/YoeB family toxin of Txe-Axe toxin-antitoxin module